MWVTLFVTLFVGSLFHPRCLAVWVSVAAFFVLPAGTTLSVQRIALTQLRCDAVVLTRVARDGQRTRVTLGSLQLAFAIAASTLQTPLLVRLAELHIDVQPPARRAPREPRPTRPPALLRRVAADPGRYGRVCRLVSLRVDGMRATTSLHGVLTADGRIECVEMSGRRTEDDRPEVTATIRTASVAVNLCEREGEAPDLATLSCPRAAMQASLTSGTGAVAACSLDVPEEYRARVSSQLAAAVRRMREASEPRSASPEARRTRHALPLALLPISARLHTETFVLDLTDERGRLLTAQYAELELTAATHASETPNGEETETVVRGKLGLLSLVSSSGGDEEPQKKHMGWLECTASHIFLMRLFCCNKITSCRALPPPPSSSSPKPPNTSTDGCAHRIAPAPRR